MLLPLHRSSSRAVGDNEPRIVTGIQDGIFHLSLRRVVQTVQPSRFERDSPAFGNIVPRPAQNMIGTPHVPRGTITHMRARMRASSRRRLDRVLRDWDLLSDPAVARVKPVNL